MKKSNKGVSAVSRKIWLRRSIKKDPCVPGKWKKQSIYKLGFAAAYETCTTSTQYFAGTWGNVFRSLLATSIELKWLDNGPGIGRDAKIAYSSLFGRYMARAHLIDRENVRILVPLEIFRKELQKNNLYHMEKKPGKNRLEADWIGLDNRGLVIAEAKGSFNLAKAPWEGDKSVPPLLLGAMKQAERTKIYCSSTGKPLPARYWAVASRWANENNGVDPTTIAWGKGGGKRKGYNNLNVANLILRADLNSLLKGLGHPKIEDLQRKDSGTLVRYDGDFELRVGDQTVGPGFLTAVSSTWNYPLRTEEDVSRFFSFSEFVDHRSPYIAVVSLSSHYISKVIQNQPMEILETSSKIEINEVEEGVCFAKFSGLTVVWLRSLTDFELW